MARTPTRQAWGGWRDWARTHPRRLAVLAAAIVVGAVALAAGDGGDGTGPEGSTLLESKESTYNDVFVYRRGDYVAMTFGHNARIYVESEANTRDDRELPVEYTRAMTVALAYVPGAASILEIGSGGGRTSWYLHRSLPKASVTSVELDPVVAAMERKYFGIRDEPGYRLVEGDGRMFLANSDARYDVILVDAYRGPFVPFHMLTREFYQLVRSRLAPGGAMAVNVEPDTMLFDSAARTIRSVFDDVDLYPAGGNVVIVARAAPPGSSDGLAAGGRAADALLDPRYPATATLAHRQPLDDNPGAVRPDAPVLTDDFAPVDAEKAIAEHNRKWTK